MFPLQKHFENGWETAADQGLLWKVYSQWEYKIKTRRNTETVFLLRLIARWTKIKQLFLLLESYAESANLSTSRQLQPHTLVQIFQQSSFRKCLRHVMMKDTSWDSFISFIYSMFPVRKPNKLGNKTRSSQDIWQDPVPGPCSPWHRSDLTRVLCILGQPIPKLQREDKQARLHLQDQPELLAVPT